MGKFEAILLIVGVVALVVLSQVPIPDQVTSESVPSVMVEQSAEPGGAAGEVYGFPILREFSTAQFHVVDGDSIRINTARGNSDLRLASIDAPEWNQQSGRDAKLNLERLVQGRTATFLQTDTDRYGRAVVFMRVGSRSDSGRQTPVVDVNGQMVADGYAWHAVRFSSSARLAEFQRQAKDQRRGLWANPHPVAPWEFRDQKKNGSR
jgi:endonuclease YncB( thermonuclease family)